MAMKISRACWDRNTRCGLRRFIRSFGIVHNASLKLISLQVALVSSLLSTIVSNNSFAAARFVGLVPTSSMYWYISPLTSCITASYCGTTYTCLGLFGCVQLTPCTGTSSLFLLASTLVHVARIERCLLGAPVLPGFRPSAHARWPSEIPATRFHAHERRWPVRLAQQWHQPAPASLRG